MSREFSPGKSVVLRNAHDGTFQFVPHVTSSKLLQREQRLQISPLTRRISAIVFEQV